MQWVWVLWACAALWATLGACAASESDAAPGNGLASGLRDVPAPPDACEVSLELRAHSEAAPGDTSPFVIEGPGDLLKGFAFKAPNAGTLHALRIEPIIDNASVLHHMMVGVMQGTDVAAADGTALGTDGSGRALLFSLPPWEPLLAPSGVGLRMETGPDVYYVLGIHYLSHEAQAMDRSGYRICATRQPMPQEAALHWLGSEDILIPGGSAYQTGADCHVQGSEPVHVISVLPHMHDLGRRFTIERLDAHGRASPLLEGAFDIDLQRNYAVDWTLQPGEGLRIGCQYENPTGQDVLVGFGAENEMCWVFTLAYPAGRLFDPAQPQRDGCLKRFDWSRL